VSGAETKLESDIHFFIILTFKSAKLRGSKGAPTARAVLRSDNVRGLSGNAAWGS